MTGNPAAGSFFETLLSEAVGPFFLDLDDGHTIVVEVPDADDVADLDVTLSVPDQLDLLVGEDTADEILDLYATRPHSELVDLVDDIRAHFALLHPPECGWAGLVDEINRYGRAIEKDFWGRPDDLYDWVRDHDNLPWDKLLRLLPALPVGGWYHAAIADDDERARQVLEMEARGELPAPSKRPSLVGWTQEREQLTEAVELLQQVVHAIWGASPKFKGKGGRPPQRHPRPQTARDRAEEHMALIEHDDIAAQLLGDRYTRRAAPEEVTRD